MAQKLYDYFLKAGEVGGIQARTRLSVLSQMTSTEAKAIADSEDRIKLIEVHFQPILREFSKTEDSKIYSNTIVDSSSKVIEKLRKHISSFADLTAQRSVYSTSLKNSAKRITETLTETLDVERASLWFYNNQRTAIECLDLFVRTNSEHSTGVVLNASDFPNYFKAISTEQTLAVNNAHTDTRTSEFSASYLMPLGINSMLDVPIWSNGKMIGVVCHEHTGDFRKWTTDEEAFAYLIGNIAGMTIENLAMRLKVTKGLELDINDN